MKILKGVCFICFSALLFVACKNKEEKINWSELEGGYSISKKINLIQSIDTKINYSLAAPVIEPYNKDSDVDEFSKGFDLNMYGIDNKISSNVKANYGLFFHKKNIIEAKKGVIIKTSKKETIKTEYLTWDQKTDRVYTDAFVTIQTDKRIINGYGLESANGLQEFKLKRISGTIYIDDQ